MLAAAHPDTIDAPPPQRRPRRTFIIDNAAAAGRQFRWHVDPDVLETAAELDARMRADKRNITMPGVAVLTDRRYSTIKTYRHQSDVLRDIYADNHIDDVPAARARIRGLREQADTESDASEQQRLLDEADALSQRLFRFERAKKKMPKAFPSSTAPVSSRSPLWRVCDIWAWARQERIDEWGTQVSKPGRPRNE